MERSAGVGDLVGYSQFDYEFHSLIYHSAGNRILEEVLESVKTRMQTVGMQVVPILINLYEDRRAILVGLRANDPGGVERAFEGHNQRVLEQIVEEIQRGQESRIRIQDFKRSLRNS